MGNPNNNNTNDNNNNNNNLQLLENNKIEIKVNKRTSEKLI